MAIKLNGVEITSNKLNSSNVTLESLNGVKVWPTAVPATSWSMLGVGNYDYVASFEETSFLVDPNTRGCGYGSTHLPSASLYLVGDIVRGRLNPASGGVCDTWVYYEAIGEAVIDNEWQFVGSYSSEPYNYDVLTSSQYLYSDYEEGINYLNINYPAGDYDEGFVVIIPDFISHDFFEYVVVSI